MRQQEGRCERELDRIRPSLKLTTEDITRVPTLLERRLHGRPPGIDDAESTVVRVRPSGMIRSRRPARTRSLVAIIRRSATYWPCRLKFGR